VKLFSKVELPLVALSKKIKVYKLRAFYCHLAIKYGDTNNTFLLNGVFHVEIALYLPEKNRLKHQQKKE
jgi:hypothetical protein